MNRLGFIGAGKMGTTLAYILQKKEYKVIGFASRTLASAEKAAVLVKTRAYAYSEVADLVKQCDVIFITTPDTAIAEVCQHIASRPAFTPEHLVVHTSGAHSTHSLEAVKNKGAGVLSLHPLQTIASLEAGLKNLPGSYFSAEGEARGMDFAREIVKVLEGQLLEIPTELKPLYHASACVVSNYFVAIINLGLSMMEKVGIARGEALDALLPLIKGTLHSIEKIGVPAALTGPISRGDAATIKAQLQVMGEFSPEKVVLYKSLGLYTVQVAEEKGSLDEKARLDLIKILEV